MVCFSPRGGLAVLKAKDPRSFRAKLHSGAIPRIPGDREPESGTAMDPYPTIPCVDPEPASGEGRWERAVS